MEVSLVADAFTFCLAGFDAAFLGFALAFALALALAFSFSAIVSANGFNFRFGMNFGLVAFGAAGTASDDPGIVTAPVPLMVGDVGVGCVCFSAPPELSFTGSILECLPLRRL